MTSPYAAEPDAPAGTASLPATPPTLDEIHITLEQFEDEITYEADGTAVLGDIRHRCPDGTPCADASRTALTHTCAACGLEFFYDPKLHECADPSLSLPTSTWAAECVAKVMR